MFALTCCQRRTGWRFRLKRFFKKEEKENLTNHNFFLRSPFFLLLTIEQKESINKREKEKTNIS